MRIPDRQAHQPMRQIIRLRSDTYTIHRPTKSSGRFGEETESFTLVTGIEIWVYNPMEVNTQTPFGERLGGDLQAVGLPNADIQYDDELTHGSETYEVEEVMHKPDENDQQYKLVSLNQKNTD